MADVRVQAAGITELEIKWASGAVDVVVVDDGTCDAIELTETASRPLFEGQQMRWRVVGGTLEIDYGSWLECMMVWRKDLEVRIPRAYASAFERVTIDGASGSYRVRGVGCGTLRLKLASGKIDVQQVAAHALSVDVASGQVSASGRFEDSVAVHAASGKAWIACDGLCPRTIDTTIASGGVHVALPATAGFTARITKASGRFSSGFPLEQSGGAYRHGDGTARMASGSFALDSVG
ncbi:DUF4097 family beta strand repeat-containing protein [Eggerthella sinensis]|uniref:DUF4097 family beta strand repeat-containing protein n=1 Tax=Eggerthella sinensis TaxID=242230 RepID=UPI00266CFE36|nr:DUF4097 family beta strand repeat-containing protein [Eggerthella sinensis]